MQELINAIINNFNGVFSKEMLVFFISMLPILELRGGLIAATFLNVDFFKAVVLCVIGNILPIPFILLFLNKVIALMERWNLTKKVAIFLKNKAEKHKSSIDKYGFWGLVLFVGVPLPGTGAWTGSLVASVFHMDIKKASLAILFGIILALIIMSIVSYGVIGSIIR